MSYTTAFSQAQDRIFYEGELKMKTGSLIKTKIFASILRNDASLYFIQIKKVPRDGKGQIIDRVDPFLGEMPYNESIVGGAAALGKDWSRIDLDKC